MMVETQIPPRAQSLLPVAEELVSRLRLLTESVSRGVVQEPSVHIGASSELWTAEENELSATRDRIIELSRSLDQLLSGPHGYFQDLIATNWDLGALYTILEFGVLERIPLDGSATASQLATELQLPERKLLNLLRLAACSNILYEAADGVFGHTAFSEELVRDDKFRAFIGFQLYETRIGSTNLADSLKQQPNTFEHGQSAIKYSLGKPLYQWHQQHEEKGQRFRMAMASVTKTLDPGDALFQDWFASHAKDGSKSTVIDMFGSNKLSIPDFAQQFPTLEFKEGLTTKQLDEDDNVLAYIIRNVFWNMPDQEVVNTVASFVPTLKRRQNAGTALLINEMLSPNRGDFTGALDHAYRRRDVTTMTMHNAKQRTEAEWRELFARASSSKFKVKLKSAHSSHSYRGLWELRLE
ncbi:hypothetical protein DV735_g548, partial [Chaetothyriales sp. CBS 134920]